jgi:hypothetical protein
MELQRQTFLCDKYQPVLHRLFRKHKLITVAALWPWTEPLGVAVTLYGRKQEISRSEVFMAMTKKNTIFWDVATCRYFVNRRFGGTYRLHLQSKSNPRAMNQRKLQLSAQLILKSRYCDVLLGNRQINTTQQ